MKLRDLAALLLLAALPALAAPKDKPQSPPPDHWVATWAAADFQLADPKATASLAFGSAEMTLREIVHISLGGPFVRVTLSNEFGTEPLLLSAVHLALTDPAALTDIQLPSAHALTFGGQTSISIPAGATVLSDPVAFAVPSAANLTLSLSIPAQTISHVTYHSSAYQANFLSPGNVVGLQTLPPTPRKLSSWYFLKSIDVRVPAQDATVVAFGDSITDGTASTPDTNQRWPDYLARRLARGGKKTSYLAVINEGIGGNRILHDGTGPSALARFDRDVLSHPGVQYLILLEGINDIGHAYQPSKPYDVVTAQDLIQADRILIERAHQHGIKVIGATLTPYLGAGYASPAGEQVRQALNAWIRTSKSFDGIVDFDKATEDPLHPGQFAPAYDHGDHLHPNDAGLKRMGEAFDLKLFDPNPKTKLDIKYFQD